MTKVAAKKTSGVVGDDLALNAEQVIGVTPSQEIPVVWAVAKGSMINKVILVPIALLISAYAPWLVVPLLMVGGAFLCYEGVEKVYEKLFHKSEVSHPVAPVNQTDKIKGAIRTDFILSAEIIIISLGTMAQSELMTRVLALSIISIAMTIGVYGLVAVIVKIDDLGLWLNQKKGLILKYFGKFLLWGTPYLMKSLGIIGTVAMFLVGGGIISHGIHSISDLLNNFAVSVNQGSWLVTCGEGLVGVVAGSIILGVIHLIKAINLKLKFSLGRE